MASAVVAGGAAVPAAGSLFSGSRRDALRIALVGCGTRGSAIAAELAALRAVGLPLEIVAVADTDLARARAMASDTGATAHRSCDKALAQRGINAAIIATPDARHYAMVRAAMQRGFDVYCEAPAALTLSESRGLLECARSCKGVFASGTDGINVDAWRLAASRVASGELGAVRWAQGRMTNVAAVPQGNWRGSWSESHGAPSCVLNAELAPLLAALESSAPTRVSGAGGVYAPGRETPDMFVVNAEYADGHSLVLSTGSRDVPAIIRCAGGSIEVTAGGIRIVRDNPTGAVGVQEEAVAYKSCLHDWALASLRDGSCFIGLQHAGMAAQVMDEAVSSYRSARDNRSV
jgi:predicted dehydrogenase